MSSARLLLVVALAWAVLAFQPAPPLVTVADCLLRSGYSRGVPATPVTALAGVDAWAAGGERVLIDGARVGTAYLADADGATRMASFYVYGGAVYVFVFKHPDDPARRSPGEPAEVWHGDCLLRLSQEGG